MIDQRTYIEQHRGPQNFSLWKLVCVFSVSLLSGLIESWRNNWGYDLPFYFAQIAPYRYGRLFEGVEVMDAQRRVLKMPNTGVRVRFAWGNTATPNLFNEAGLPASCFITD